MTTDETCVKCGYGNTTHRLLGHCPGGALTDGDVSRIIVAAAAVVREQIGSEVQALPSPRMSDVNEGPSHYLHRDVIAAWFAGEGA